MNRITRWMLALVAVIGLGSAAASAQVVTTSAITGRITDATTGETLPGVNVVAVHLPTNTQYGVATRIDGRYTLTGLRPGGPYTVTVSYIGYRTEQVADVQLSLGQELELDIALREQALEAGEVLVEVDRGGIINADRTGAQTNISREQIERLPTVNRAISDFTRLNPQSTGFNSFAGRNNLYNNISIDGSVFNNVFGLSSEVGGQTRAQPISLDAVEQISVDIAPYDVRQGSFTGAGINVITRSGTNQFRASAYSYIKNQSLVSERVAGDDVTPVDFSERQTGLSLSGPIIRDRLFLFVNGEMRNRIDPGATFRPRTSPGETGAGIAAVDQATLEQIRSALVSQYSFDPGSFEPYDLESGSENLTAKLDWNINAQHRASLRFNYLNSDRDTPVSNSSSVGGRQNSQNTVPFSSANYIINNDVLSLIGQVNSTFGNRYANQFTLGYTAMRDSRGVASPSAFPLVDILQPGGSNTLTAFGYEPFSANNKLDTDVYQLTNNFTMFLGQHTLTLGTSNEFYSFSNGFTPWWNGYYQFRSADDFLAHINAPDPAAPGVPQPRAFRVQYSLTGGVPFAEISAAQVGLYVQDEFRALNNLKLTFGLRMDMPIFTSDLPTNETVAGLTFANGERLDTGKMPDAAPLWSPRLGFNWDTFSDRTLQVRGGTGIFTGKIPFVWVSNQASNSGLTLGETFVSAPSGEAGNSQYVIRAPDGRQITFDPDRTAYLPENPSAPPTVLINTTAEDFKFPQVWRSNVAVDARLPFDVIATLEGIYSKDLNAVFHRDANLKDPIGTFEGADNRARFSGSSSANRRNPGVTNAIVLDNTSKGYQYLVTGQLEKTFNAGALDGLFTRFSYTTGEAKDLTSSTSSIAATAYFNNQVYTSPGDPVLGYSAYDQRHRVVGVAAYRLEALGFSGTTLSLIWTGGSGANYSYTYGNDMNGDGISGNDLMYIPRSADEINLVPGNNDSRTPAQIWADLDAFIAQDPYLSENRGAYAERGGARAPWVNRVDIGVKQQFFVNLGGRRTGLEFSLDLINVGNLFNSEWGVVQRPITTAPLSFQRVENNEPVFQFAPRTETFTPDVDLSSRWQAQFGLKLTY